MQIRIARRSACSWPMCCSGRTGLQMPSPKPAPPLDLAPRLAQAWSLLATVLEARHRDSDAMEALRRAVTLRPSYPLPRERLARALVDSNRLDEALEHFTRLAGLGSADPPLPPDKPSTC